MKKIVFLLLTLALVTSCGKKEVQEVQKVQEVKKVQEKQVAIGDWKLVSLNGKSFDEITKNLDFGEIIANLSLKEDGYRGKAFINNYHGKIEKLDGNSIKFGITASTMMGGPRELMGAEREFHQTLKEIDSFEIKNGQLILKAKGEEKFVFEKTKISK